MPISRLIPQVLMSPEVIAAAVFLFLYGAIVGRVAAPARRRFKAAMLQKTGRKIKMPPKQKPALSKNDDISGLNLK